MERVELHCHSYFSEQDGTVQPWELIEYAKECCMTAIALTDTNTVLGYPLFRGESRHHDIKAIYGIEVDGKTVLIKDQLGKRILYKLISDVSRNPNNDLYMEILKHKEHFLIGSGNAFADLPRSFLNNEENSGVDELISQYDFIEIQPHTCHLSLIDSNEYENVTCEQDLIKLNLRLIEMGEKYNIPVVATSDSYYINDEDKLCREIVRSHAGYEEEKSNRYFRDTMEMLAEFPYLSKEKIYEVVVANTNKIADMCEHIELMLSQEHFPRKSSDAQTLNELCKVALYEKYGDDIPEEIDNRVKWELDALHNTKMEFQILYLHDMIKNLNIKPHQIGFRGMAGNVYVCYLLGITDVDPFKYHLASYFALGYDKSKELDIDMNFSEKVRQDAIDFYKNEEDFITIPGWLMNMYRDNTEELIDLYQEKKGIVLSERQRQKLDWRISSLYVNSSLHSHGVLMVPKDLDIYEVTPVVIDEVGNDVTLFEYHAIDLAIYKQDLLSHYGLDILEELESVLGVVPDDLTFDEPEILDMFKVDDIDNTLCKDIIDCRSKETREMMKAVRIKSFDDLVKVFGLSHGTGTWIDNAAILLADNKAGIETLIGTRDDVFDYLCSYGMDEETAFKITEQVRKGLWNRGVSSRYMEYVERMHEVKVPDWFIWSCSQICYLFPRAHAISYARMNWRLAWYKLNYPDTFHSINEKHYAKFEKEREKLFY